MNSKIIKVAGTETKVKIIRFFSLVNDKKKYICFINYSGKGLNLSTINLGYVSSIGDKIIVFKIGYEPEWSKVKIVMENLFTTGTSNDIVTYPVDNFERIDIVNYNVFDKPITNYSTFFNIKEVEQSDVVSEVEKPTPVVAQDLEVIGIDSSITPTVVDTQNTTQVTSPTGPTRKKGSKTVIVLAIILLVLAIAAALYYFKDEIFKEKVPTNNNIINEPPRYADNELMCTMSYNDNESNGIISEKLVYVFTEDNKSLDSVKAEKIIKFTDEEEYTTSKQNAQMGLAFATMFGVKMNIDSDDTNLTYTVIMEMSVDEATESDIKVAQSGSYTTIKEQALTIGYTCNGDDKELLEDVGNNEIISIDDLSIIVNDGWRVVTMVDAPDEEATGMKFSVHIRHLNDSTRNLNGILTTYDENKNPLSETTLSSIEVKGNSYFNIDLDTELETEKLVEIFDFNNIKYFSIKIN